jgi:hypothetical protein
LESEGAGVEGSGVPKIWWFVLDEGSGVPKMWWFVLDELLA